MVAVGKKRFPHRSHRIDDECADKILRLTGQSPVTGRYAGRQIFKESKLLSDVIRRVAVHKDRLVAAFLIEANHIQRHFVAQFARSRLRARCPERYKHIRLRPLEQVIVFDLGNRRIDAHMARYEAPAIQIFKK